MVDNIVVGALPQTLTSTPTRYSIPLSIPDDAEQLEVTVTIDINTVVLFFSINKLSGTLMISAYTLNQATIYFLGFQANFGNYINLIDNGCPYLFYFVDNSSGKIYANNSKPIDFEALKNGVGLYAELR